MSLLPSRFDEIRPALCITVRTATGDFSTTYSSISFGSSPSPTPTEPPLQIHSPLAKHTLGELPEIVSSPYDPPEFWDDARHHGVDFCYFQGEEEEKTIEGEGIQAIFSGVVVASIEGRFPYGNMVIVETAYEELPAEFVFMLGMQPDESLYHLYAHFQEGPEVALGERVEGGQALGQVGKTGYNIEVPHLHLETRIGSSGAVFERMVYYDVTAKEEEMEAYELWRTSGVFRHFDPMEILGGAGDGGEEAEDE
ncbi:MAG: hypothetical protein MAG431_01893 [Chloroflexi bacterium]|nr:hypothetical protein [Chloroflexota bacterium]